MSAPNGATYTVEQVETKTRGLQWGVRIEHPQHEARVIVGGYNNNPFESEREARWWSEADGRFVYAPGQPVFARQPVNQDS